MSVERQGRMASEQGLELEVHAVHAGFHELPQKADGRCRLQIRESKKSNGNCNGEGQLSYAESGGVNERVWQIVRREY